MGSRETQPDNPEVVAAGGRFFDAAFDPDAFISPAEVNPEAARLFSASFYEKYKAVMCYSSALVQHWGVNENGEFFDRDDYSIKGYPQPGKELQQTVVLGFVWPQQGADETFGWQVNVADNMDRQGGRRIRLHSLFLNSNTEWLGVTRHYNRQLQQTRVESLDVAAIGDLYKAVRYLIKCSDVEVRAEGFRADQLRAAPKIAQLYPSVESGKASSAATQQWAELKRIGFQPAPWYHRLTRTDLQ